MIEFRFEEEYQYAVHYARKLSDAKALNILERRAVSDSEEAKHLSEFFWRMVDASIEDEKLDIDLPWSEGAEFWNEKIMNSVSGYLERSGYEKEWDEVLDRQ